MADKLKQFFLSNSGLWLIFISWTLFISNLWLPRNWDFYGTDDWDLTYSTFEVARKSIVEYGQWPSFNPFAAFGSDLDANPQATHASIFFIPVLLFGTFYGYKVSILSAIIIGCWGAFKLFNDIQQDRLVSLCMSLVFCGCAYFSRHIFQAGHSNVLYFYFLPWLVFFLNRLILQGKFSHFLWPVLILSQTIMGGAPFVFIACVLLMLLWAIGLWWIEKSGPRPLWMFSLVILFSAGLAFWKIWSVIGFWEQMPRHVTDDTGINLLVWLQAFCDLETDTRTYHGWHEFAMGYSLVLAGLTIYHFKNINNWKKWLLLSIPIFWLSFGNMPPYLNPWYFLNHFLPVFDGLRAPYRFGLLVVFISSLSFIKVINYIYDKSLLYSILIAVVLTQTLSYNSVSKKIIGSARLSDLNFGPQEKNKPLRLSSEQKFRQFVFIKEGRLVQNAYEPLFLSQVTDSMENFVEGGELRSFSPHKITIEPDDHREVLISIRYSANWYLTNQGIIQNKNGLLWIQHPGKAIDMRYRNPHRKEGLWVSIGSIILLICSFIFFRKQKNGLNAPWARRDQTKFPS